MWDSSNLGMNLVFILFPFVFMVYFFNLCATGLIKSISVSEYLSINFTKTVDSDYSLSAESVLLVAISVST